ncbi:hypothetical protein JCM21714_1913 [Gracilibacillus boraciitolerans JCM 21714]|uniref:PepSY domain-containing protein n=1 Tax=Gracilibacillus boraciitolerans JCM 21714 TaxID=1298598 RepID=W4VHL7_9BACI|nr:PepSY domain-containing protein [Gracilibacillus boraciitolerans]GAE92890.1 hypothetical protein JCM21714_1913 [Gracilibacillus boraciitolerans JCM 21714]
MNKKNTIIIACIAFSIGYLFRQQQDNKQYIKPEKALISVKESFQKKYEVSGSWIYMKPETFLKNDLQYEVYHGGITKFIDNQHVPYEFYIDAHTGTLIDMLPQHG